MTSFEDAHGLAFTAASPDSVARFEGLTAAYLGFRRDMMKQLAVLLEADPEMPMAVCARGYFMKMSGMKALMPEADAQLARLDEMEAAGRLNPRERLHKAALARWCAGDLEATTGAWEQILLDHPLDAFALRLAHFTHFYSGDGRQLRDSVARLLPRWPADHPLYGFVLGMYGFGLEESGDYARAERFGRAAVERNPEDAWSVHSVAHCLEMTERHAEGIAWTKVLEPSWSKVNNFRNHIHWHRALYHLERREFAEVLELYDSHIGAEVDSPFYLDMVNATAMLWRLEMFGADVGGRWQELAEVAKKHIPDDELIFVSLHYLMALVSAGGQADIDAMMAHLEAWAARQTTQGWVTAEVGLGLARGMVALRQQNYDRAVKEMVPIRYAIDPIGGSHAQRDVFWMMLTDAAARGSDPKLAVSLFAERSARRPHSAWGWERYADCLAATGAEAEAARARKRAEMALLQ